MSSEKGLGLSRVEMSGERTRVFLLACLSMVLHSSSFALCKSSLIWTESSIAFLDRSISSYSLSWLTRDASLSAWVFSCNRFRSSRNSLACHFTSSLSCCSANIVSMICWRVGVLSTLHVLRFVSCMLPGRFPLCSVF